MSDGDMSPDPDLLDEYDFSEGVRGKYAARFREKTNVVLIDTDLIEDFPDSKSVNEALRAVQRSRRDKAKAASKK